MPTFLTEISFPLEVVWTEMLQETLVATLYPLYRTKAAGNCELLKCHLILEPVSVLQPKLIVAPAGTVTLVGVVGRIAVAMVRPIAITISNYKTLISLLLLS